MDIDTNNQANDNELEEFNEIPMTSNGDVVMIIAWGVGGVVAVVAVLLWLMIMMMIRAILAFMLDNFGVSGIAIITLGADKAGEAVEAGKGSAVDSQLAALEDQEQAVQRRMDALLRPRCWWPSSSSPEWAALT
mmetsp:Transcript_3547/g.5325  ORF Transcript_3547/g.5325 Transcript_3547/m.5325 type:complete len:134 (-) Transcript_3547:2069-2470(-)